MSNNGSNGNHHTDYASIEIPDPQATPRTQWSWRERRAELLDMVLTRGGPTRLPSQQSLGKTYGVSQSQISQDLDALADYTELAPNMAITIQSAFHRIYDALMDDGKFMDAWRVVEGFERLAERRGAIPREPQKFDLRHGEVPTETDSYELVTDDDEEPAEGEKVVTAEDLRPDMPSEGRPGGEGEDD